MDRKIQMKSTRYDKRKAKKIKNEKQKKLRMKRKRYE